MLRRLSPLWQVQRRRHPAAAARAEEAALALRTRGDLLGEVRSLRRRLQELERDHLLLAAHVSSVTERLGADLPPSVVDDEGARQRARTAAVAFYEERIGRLEERVLGTGRARPVRPRVSIDGTSGEHDRSAS